MFKRNSLRKYFTLILMFFTLVVGFSSWIIVGEKNANLGVAPSTRAVAYIEYDCFSSNTYTATGSYSSNYTSIEAALRFAESGDCVHVIINKDDPAVIRYDCEIKSGVLLNISYEDKYVQMENSDGIVEANLKYAETAGTNNGAETDPAFNGIGARNLTNIVKINDNVTVINNGMIIISGELSGGQGGAAYVGHTCRKYAKLIIGNNSRIENYNKIICCGFIEESYLNNKSSLINYVGSSLRIPFVLRDFRGGTTSSGIVSATEKLVSPFNQFEINNIQCEMIIKYGSELSCYANIAANNSIYRSLIGLIGNDNTYFISLFNSNKTDYEKYYARIKYDSSSLVCHYDMYGGAFINSISISFGTITPSTEKVFFPMSWRMNLTMNKYYGQEGTAIFNAENQKIKLMTGASLIVYSGCEFISSDMIVYSFFRDRTDVGTSNIGGTKYDIKDPAIFKVYGKYTYNGSFGGLIIKGDSADIPEGDSSLEVFEALTQGTLGTIKSWTVIQEKKLDVFENDIKNMSRITVGVIRADTWDIPTYQISGDYTSETNISCNLNFFLTTGKTFTPKFSNSSATINGTSCSSETILTVNKKNELLIIKGNEPTDSGECLLPGTMITMSDGTKKPVEQIQSGDMLKVFNHYTGEYDVSPVVFNDSEPKQNVNVINLEFSNGSYIGVVAEHGFFDLDLMKYVYIDEYNYNDYIGHRFYSDGNNIVTLNRAYITTQYTEVYSPVTAYHLNYFTEDILSMPGGIEGLFNIFEYDDDLKYNEELMKQDIEKYGLYTYEDFKDYCSYEFYQAFPAEYLKVSVGKGYITFDEIIYLINRYKTKV